MTKVYLVRHAEAEGNYYRRIQGHYNGGITRRGYLQIDALAERFRDIHIDALYSSDLRRTMITAGAIKKHHDLPLKTDRRLREIDMGAWEDLPWGNASHDDSEQLFLFSTDPEKWSVPNCEPYLNLQKRIYDTILELAAKHDGETIAIFCHGTAIRSLICKIKGVASADICQIGHGDNTCVALLDVDKDKYEIEYYNDNSHLAREISTFAKQSWWKGESKVDTSNLRFVIMDLMEDAQLYMDCYADSWQQAHGDLAGFDPRSYLGSAKAVSAASPRALMKASVNGNDFAGIVELDPKRMAQDSAGWISFFYLVPELRGRGFAPQLLGHAVSFYRNLGRKTLRLHVAETNARAIVFYENEGFVQIGSESGAGSRLLLMEKDI